VPPSARFDFDAAYVERLIVGDPETERHFTSYFGDLIRLKLRSRLRSAILVEDVTQEVFLRVMATLRGRGLESAPSLGAFVNTVCNHVLFETYRAETKGRLSEPDQLPGLEAPAPSAEAVLVDRSERATVRKAILALPERERALLHSLFFDERPKDDICRDLGIDREYLRVLVHRAKVKFREIFAELNRSGETLGPRPAPIEVREGHR
jgi:RNA polymerase sigma-70 factor (ECF subfamily)